MGQKINPIGLRLGINRTWDSRWFANSREYGKLLHEDMAIREYLKTELKQANYARVDPERIEALRRAGERRRAQQQAAEAEGSKRTS